MRSPSTGSLPARRRMISTGGRSPQRSLTRPRAFLSWRPAVGHRLPTWWTRGSTAGCGSGWRLRRHTAVDRPRGVLQLDLRVGGGLDRHGGVCLGLSFGVSADAGGVVAEGLPAGLFAGVLARSLFNLSDHLGDAGARVVVFIGWFGARHLGLPCSPGACAGGRLACWGPWLARVDGALVLALDRTLDSGHVRFQLAQPFQSCLWFRAGLRPGFG